jgi:hypothetical protein
VSSWSRLTVAILFSLVRLMGFVLRLLSRDDIAERACTFIFLQNHKTFCFSLNFLFWPFLLYSVVYVCLFLFDCINFERFAHYFILFLNDFLFKQLEVLIVLYILQFFSEWASLCFLSPYGWWSTHFCWFTSEVASFVVWSYEVCTFIIYECILFRLFQAPCVGLHKLPLVLIFTSILSLNFGVVYVQNSISYFVTC